MMKLKKLQKSYLKYFDEQTLWDQGKDIEEFYYCLDLEEALLGHLFEAAKSAKDIQYKVGDILMANNFQDNRGDTVNSPHRILIITSTEGHSYTGFIMSSKVNKASVYPGGFAGSILVDNVADIITHGQKPVMPCIVKVNHEVSLTNQNFTDFGVYKGHVSNEFLEFIKTARELYTSGKDTSSICWQDKSGRIVVNDKI